MRQLGEMRNPEREQGVTAFDPDREEQARRERELRAQYTQWLEGYQWTYMATFTFRSPVKPLTAADHFRKWVSSWESASSAELRWAFAVEKGELGGRAHLHVLLGCGSAVLKSQLSASWRKGHVSIVHYDRDQGGVGYVVKHIAEQQSEYDFDKRLGTPPMSQGERSSEHVEGPAISGSGREERPRRRRLRPDARAEIDSMPAGVNADSTRDIPLRRVRRADRAGDPERSLGGTRDLASEAAHLRAVAGVALTGRNGVRQIPGSAADSSARQAEPAVRGSSSARRPHGSPFPPQELAQKWRADAELMIEYGSSQIGQILVRVAQELEASLNHYDERILKLEEAAEESGYSRDHLQRLIREGVIPNSGRKHAPRIRRGDLPRKPGGSGIRAQTPAEAYDTEGLFRDVSISKFGG